MGYENEKKQFKTYFFVIALVVSFALGVFVEKRNGGDGSSLGEISGKEGLSQENLGFLEDVWGILNKEYVGEMPSLEDAVKGAAKGLVSSLGDPYTVFWNEDESKNFSEEMEGSFEGIGAEIGIKDQMLTVIAALDGTPAKDIGLKSGDKILKINDELTTEMTLDEAVNKIRGPKGTKVRLTVFKSDNGNSKDPIEIEITRSKIDIKSVTWKEESPGIAYVRVSGFLKDTETEFARIAEEIRKSKDKKIILDLRSNPGGYLDAAVNLAGYFITPGSVVVIEDFGQTNKQENKSHFTSGKAIFKDYPLVILVDGGTASSAEILAGAIRDNRGVKLVGEKTFGKGSVQEVNGLKDGSMVKVTVAKWLTPNRANIDKEGLVPDFLEKIKAEGDNNQEDNQLKKAVEILKNGN